MAGADVFDAFLALLEARGVVRCDANSVSLAGRQVRLDERWEGFASQVEARIRAGGLAPPETDTVGEQLGIPPRQLREVLRYLVANRRVVEAAPTLHFAREPFEAALARLTRLFAEGPERTTSEIRQELGMNRKYVVPLVEMLDRLGYTKRSGDTRRWVAGEGVAGAP